MLGLALSLGGCGGAGSTNPSPALGVSPPPALTSARAIDRTELRPVVTLGDGRRVDVDPLDAGRWSGTIDLVPGLVYALRVVWIETIGERELQLASSEQTVTVGADGAQVDIETSNYVYDFDLDADGVSNFDERERDTDPFRAPGADDSSPIPADPSIPFDGDGEDGEGNGEGDSDPEFPTAAEITAEIVVPRVAREDAPSIDGLGVVLNENGRYGGEWSAATQLDAAGDPLLIGNLMIDGGTDETDDAPRRRWAAVHDGEYLYVLVVIDDGRRFRDSTELWNDDSLEVYIDGNGSSSPIHDDDDVQRVLPMIAPDRDGTGVDEGIVPGFFLSQAPVEIDFMTGPGLGPRSGQDVYELRIELGSANIVPGRPFGFELQVNDDDDGGSREGKWGWAHPARGTEDVDLTFFDPSYMGTAILE